VTEGRVTLQMPQLGNGIESALVEEWLIGVGEPVQKGDPVVLIETDKASMELESPVTGRLAAVIAEDGTEVEVGEVIAEFEPT
jgi:2-oxoglutarate dehydrogenase E2 component (dihydrolipoamide succinyltransferase)